MAIRSIAFDNVSFGFEDEESLFSNVSCELPLNKNVSIIGKQGSGKSTLMRMCIGLLQPKLGSVVINDERVTDMSFEEFMPFRKQIGFSFDLGGLLNNRTLLENLTLPLLYHRLMSPEDAHAKAMSLLEVFNIASSAGLRPSSVPGRTRKAVIVARSFIFQPEMLVLDDPTTGLSQEARLSLIGLIADYKQHHGLRHLFFVTEDKEFHNQMTEVELHVDRTRLRVVTDEN